MIKKASAPEPIVLDSPLNPVCGRNSDAGGGGLRKRECVFKYRGSGKAGLGKSDTTEGVEKWIKPIFSDSSQEAKPNQKKSRQERIQKKQHLDISNWFVGVIKKKEWKSSKTTKTKKREK